MTTANFASPSLFCPATFSALGTSLGDGIVVYQIAQSDKGLLTRIELGRSKMHRATSPSCLNTPLASLQFLVVIEPPLYVNLSMGMSLARFDSDNDDEGDDRRFYFMDWRPEVRGMCFHSRVVKSMPEIVSVGRAVALFPSWQLWLHGRMPRSADLRRETDPCPN